jgi:hypothetical protein
MVSNFRLKVEFDPKNRFLGIVARNAQYVLNYGLVIASQAVFCRVRRFLANREA